MSTLPQASPSTRTPNADEVTVLPSPPPSCESSVHFLKKRKALSIGRDNMKRLRSSVSEQIELLIILSSSQNQKTM